MTDNQERLVNSIKNLKDSFKDVLDAIELESDFDVDICNGYPFDKSFDEVYSDVIDWNFTMAEYYKSNKNKYVCSICKKEFTGWGNNPYPVTKGEHDRCCDDCNYQFVIPARLNQELMPLEKGE